MAIFSKGYKQYYDFGSRNSQMLSFTSTWGLLCWLWIFPWIEFSWLSCSMWEKPGWLWQFHCEGLFSFNLKEFCYSYVVWSCRLFEERTSFCRGLVSRKLCGFLLMFSAGFTSLSLLLFFPLLIAFFVFMHGFLIPIFSIKMISASLLTTLTI